MRFATARSFELVHEDHRRAKGPFRSVEELKLVKGVGPVTFDKVSPFLRVEQSASPSEHNRFNSCARH